MQDWNRREVLRTLGFSSLGLGLSNCASPLVGVTDAQTSDDEIRRLLYNENPNGPSALARKRISENIGRSNRYCTFHPYDFNALKTLIAKQEGLQAENVLLGHGSFEPLCWLATHFGMNQGEIVVPSPTFDVVGLFGRKIGAVVKPVEVTDDFKMNLRDMQTQVSDQTRLLTLCNPNNPTGTTVETDQLRQFCQSVSQQCPVLIDEAYIHYLDNWRQHTMTPLVAAGQNIIIARTFSKIYGMAGLRIGFILGPATLIKELESKFTLGFPGNMPNSLSVAAAMGALQAKGFVDESRQKNASGRNQLYAALKAEGLTYIPSDTNFVYFDVKDFAAFKSYMRDHNIILAGGWPTKPNWGRVTIGSPQEMAYFMEKLKGKPWL